jgi:hypothetical protein
VVAVKTALLGKSHPKYECDAPNWYDRRPPLMNERPSDHHDNGIRAWLIEELLFGQGACIKSKSSYNQ